MGAGVEAAVPSRRRARLRTRECRVWSAGGVAPGGVGRRALRETGVGRELRPPRRGGRGSYRLIEEGSRGMIAATVKESTVEVSPEGVDKK